MNYKRLFLYIIISLLIIVPVFLVIINTEGKFSDYKSITHTFGQIFGLVGMTLFSITFILLTKIKFIEDAFNGLNKLYLIHGTFGIIALFFILLHPIFLVLKFIPNQINILSKYFLPSSFWSANFGIIAFILIILLTSITLCSKIKYQKWKFFHSFLGIVFILSVLHIIFVKNTISQDNIFNGYYIYVGIISVIGLGSYFYNVFLRDKLISGAKYIIKEVNKKELGIYEIIMSPKYSSLKYKSGQFVFLTFNNKKLGKEAHPFSIASSSNSVLLRVIIKNLGDFTSKIKHLNPGEEVYVEGPYGRFNYNRKGEIDEIWIAGGIGITPFLGMAKDLLDNPNIENEITLYYSANGEGELVGLDELNNIKNKCKNFNVIPWNTEIKKHLKVRDIFNISKTLRNKEFYICCPENFKKAMIKGLLKEGVNKKNIHTEEFKFR